MTDPKRWSRIDAALDAGLDLPLAERAAWLADLARREPDIAAEVGRLLAAVDGPNLLDRALPELAPELVSDCLELPEEVPPETAGPYRLLKEIGRGGMGAVYLAERSDGQYEKQVAVKLVRPGPDLGGMAQRFRQERQILASLEHPGIARLLDGGVTDAGVPYLVMEYVEGQPIDRYADANRLDTTARLTLFDRVAEVVEYAHRRLVIHRDLKPGNILVTENGEVKLLDFGIAKLLDEGDGPEPVTRTGAVLATPEYASPEQIRGRPVSTATDVYALGVLLYELLSGRRPYRATSATPHELAVEICDTIPPRPGLGADLDAIVLTALAKEPEHRYGSVELFRDDLARFRDGFPVRARPATRRYLTRKFLERNRGRVAAGALLAVAVAAGFAATLWQAATARREARRAEQVTEFLTGIFEASDPDRAGGREVTARELLDRGADRLDTELRTEPSLRADMLRTLGVLYHRLGLYDQAQPLLERAGVVLDSIGAPPLDRAAQTAAFAALLHDLGQDSAALAVAETTLALRRRAIRGDDTRLAAAIGDLAVLHGRLGHYDRADSLFQAELAIEQRLADTAAVASTLGNWAIVLGHRGEPDRAAALEEEALALNRKHYGPEHTDVATALQNLAATRIGQGRYDSAETLLREAIGIRERLLGPEHPLIATVLAALGNAYQQAGRYDSADAVDRRVLAIRLRALGHDHPDVAETYNNLGVNAYFRARYPEAVSYLDSALAIWRPALGPTHPNVLTALSNQGAILRAKGDLAAAEGPLRQALALRVERFGEDHPSVASSHNNLAGLLDAQGKDREALDHYNQAERIWRAALGDHHVTVAEALYGKGKYFLRLHRYGEAEAVLREALDLRLTNLDSTSTGVANARRELGFALIGLGRRAEAAPLLEAALPRLVAAFGEADATVVRTRQALAGIGRP
ncbi:MAG: serine/threonine-protein kinase [Gemmatimonadales bacterium]